jgi:hypothetical protein
MLPGLLYLTLAMGPSVAVEVTPPQDGTSGDAMESLRSWLVQRLIEEGVTIAPSPERADRVVRLHDTDDAVIVETEKEEHRIEHGPAAVMRLEVLHRARLVIEGPDDDGTTRAPAGSVIGMRSEGEAPIGFEGALESQLLSAGYVLTPDPREGDPVLCVQHDKVAVSVSLTKVGAVCGDPTIRLTYTQIQSPGGVDPIVEAVRGRKVPVAPVPQQSPTADDIPVRAQQTPPPPTPEDTRRRKRVPWSQDNAEVRIGAEGGIAARGAIDGSVRAFIRMGIAPGPGALLHVGVVPSGAGRSLRTVDTVLAAGPDVHLRRKRFGFDAGLVAGANIHAYQVDRDKGGRVTWYVGLPLNISFGRQFGPRVHFFTEAAMAGIRPVEHVIDSAVRWRRTAWLVRAGLGVSFGWRIL